MCNMQKNESCVKMGHVLTKKKKKKKGRILRQQFLTEPQCLGLSLCSGRLLLSDSVLLTYLTHHITVSNAT